MNSCDVKEMCCREEGSDVNVGEENTFRLVAYNFTVRHQIEAVNIAAGTQEKDLHSLFGRLVL